MYGLNHARTGFAERADRGLCQRQRTLPRGRSMLWIKLNWKHQFQFASSYQAFREEETEKKGRVNSEIAAMSKLTHRRISTGQVPKAVASQ